MKKKKNRAPKLVERIYTTLKDNQSIDGMPYSTLTSIKNIEKADKTFQTSGTLRALTHVEVSTNKKDIIDLTSLKCQYNSVMDMIVSNPHFLKEYKTFLLFMMRLESWLHSWIDRTCSITVDCNTDVLSVIPGLQSFCMKIQGEKDAMLLTFYYCSDESLQKSDGSLDIAITQSVENNYALIHNFNIAYDKLSDAMHKFMICHNSGDLYYGDYAALIESISDRVVYLNESDFTHKRNCGLIGELNGIAPIDDKAIGNIDDLWNSLK